MDALLPQVTIDGFAPHWLHGPDRCWSETNCYVDLWIEVIHALGLPAEAMLGFTARQDFEGDQFSFTKPPLEDLERLFGLRVQELAIYEPVEQHVVRQMARGRMCLVEVDPWYLPDTGQAAYRTQHGKTTIAPNRIDVAGKRLEYFHNAGYFALEGEDFDGVFPASTPYGAPFRPYVEFTTLEPSVRADAELKALAGDLFAGHWARRPLINPIRAFQQAAPAQAEALAGRGEQAFHDFAFHNLRLLGANFDLMGSHLAWLSDGVDPRIGDCHTIAETAKGAQFQLARAVARRRFDGFAQALDPAAEAWDRLTADEPVATRPEAGMGPMDDGWALACTAPDACATPADAAGLTDWIAAPVPGTSARALEAAGRWRRMAPEPLHDKDIWYRRSVTETGRRRLRFEGLATFCEVWLDEVQLAVSASMFAPLEVEADLREGGVLWLCFRALTPRLASTRGSRARWRPRMIEPQALRLVRTTLLGHMPGWCPPVDAVGPFRPVSAIDPEAPRLLERRIVADWTPQGGRLDVEVTLAGGTGTPILRCAGAEADMSDLGEGRFRSELSPEVEPWLPHSHGDQPLYDAEIEVGGQRLPLGRVGFRRIEVDGGADGRGFGLVVNGTPVFCRGACWITPDLVALGGERQDYEPTLRATRDGGFNMVRVSGVGLYETRAFFELCDELGLLVWQDFMFANFDYPAADAEFVRQVEAEARHLLEQTQGSPSLAVLCGGSEVFQQAAMMGLAPGDLTWPLFDEVLKRAAAAGRPDAPYLANTPMGGPLPFAVAEGVSHYYGVGAYQRPMEDARRAQVRFASECLALANVPDADGLAAFSTPAFQDARWEAAVPRDRGAGWDFEDVREHYLAQLLGQDPHRLRREEPDLYLDLSRAISGEVMAAVFAEWRGAGSSCRGGLVWTLRDLAPGPGWGLIDANGRAKPALAMLSRVLRPRQVLITDEGVDGVAIHLVNETASALEGELRLTVHSDEPGAILESRRPVRLEPRTTSVLSAFELIGRFYDLTYAYRFGPRSHSCVLAQLICGGEVVSDALYLPPGVEGWANAGQVTAELSRDGEGWAVSLVADRLQRFVRVQDAAFRALDDWLTLPPGEPRRVRLSSRQGTAAEQRPRGEIFGPGGRYLGAYDG